MVLLTPLSQGTHLLSVGRLIVVSSLSPITIVSSANLTMTLELCVAVQSCVYREYRRGLRTQPCGAPVLRVRGDEVVAHSDLLTSACQEVQDPATQRSV